jgi:hypothetical protein
VTKLQSRLPRYRLGLSIGSDRVAHFRARLGRSLRCAAVSRETRPDPAGSHPKKARETSREASRRLFHVKRALSRR